MMTIDLDRLWPEGRNLLRYDREDCVLSDFHSPVAVGAWDADAMGITKLHLQGYVPGAEYAVLDPFLRLFVGSDGGWQPVPVVDRTCWPGGWVEYGRAAGLEIRQYVWFQRHSELRVHWEALPLTDGPGTAALALAGGHTAAHLWLTADADNNEVRVGMESLEAAGDTDDDRWLHGVMRLHTSPSYDVCRFRTGLSQNSLAPMAEELAGTTAGGQSLGYWLELPALACSPSAPAVFDLTAAWAFNGAAPPATEECYDFVANIERWQGLIESVPLPAGNAYWRRKGAVAVAGLLTSLIQSPGYGNLSAKLGIGARTLGHLSHTYFWDTMTTVPALAQLDPDWGAEVIDNFTQYLGNHDCPPFALSAFPVLGQAKRAWRGSQAPIAAWAVQKRAACTGDAGLVERLYPALTAIDESWFEHADPGGHGIPVWMNTGATADDSPLYDQYAGAADWHNIYLPPIASVCLCSYLLMDLKCLQQMAATLGREDEAARWRDRAAALDRKIIELLWHDDEKIFYDRDLTTFEPTRVKTFYNLLPLWAGVSLSAADAHAAIDRHLLNPEELWGQVPFPSVAYNEPTYDPMGYWRGRGWPHIYFWNTEILARYGYAAEAEEAKHRFLALLADTIDIPENFVSTVRTDGRREHGLPHYSWGLATTLYFLWDWHLQPVT